MTAVFTASENDRDDIGPLFRLLSAKHSVSALSSNNVNINHSSEFLLLPLQSRSISVNCNCAAIMFAPCSMAKYLPENCIILCFDEQTALCCSGKKRQLISCGMHNKDTVTLSSMESGKPVLSIQRQLAAFSGDIIDVGDYPLITDENDHRLVMAAAVLLLLCGNPLDPDSFYDQSSTTVPPTLSK